MYESSSIPANTQHGYFDESVRFWHPSGYLIGVDPLIYVTCVIEHDPLIITSHYWNHKSAYFSLWEETWAGGRTLIFAVFGQFVWEPPAALVGLSDDPQTMQNRWRASVERVCLFSCHKKRIRVNSCVQILTIKRLWASGPLNVRETPIAWSESRQPS